jgi:ABC-2 type transport system permease protein
LKFQQGTLSWLLQHELQLWWRGFSGKWIVIGAVAFMGIVVAVMSILWLSLSSIDGRIRQGIFSGSLPDGLLWMAGGVFVLLFGLSLISATNQSLAMMFEQGDLDLLVSSPVSMRTVLASRLLVLAIENFLGICTLIVLPSLIAIALGFIRILGSYPALLAMCLVTSGLGMLINIGLVRLLGARTARMVSQFIGYIFSVGFFLLSQSATLFRVQFQAALAWWHQATMPDGCFYSQSWIWLPAKAMFADLPSLTLLIAGSALTLWLTVEVSHQAFMQGTQQSLTTPNKRLTSTERIHFGTNFNWIFLLKEWKSIVRSPYILSQLLYAIIAFIPLAILTFQKSNTQSIDGILTILAMGLPVAGATFTSTLGAVCFSAEEAPELLKSSPVASYHLRRLKLLAVLIPGWVISFPLFLMLIIKGGDWFSTGIVFMLATICHTLFSLWSSRPIPLASLFSKQQGSGDYGLLILQSISFVVLVGLAVGVAQKNWLSIGIFFTTELILVVAAYWRSREIGTSLGF